MVGEMTKIEMSGSFMWIKYFNLHVLRLVGDEPKIVINIYNSSRTVKVLITLSITLTILH
jgi:hypothetical protein